MKKYTILVLALVLTMAALTGCRNTGNMTEPTTMPTTMPTTQPTTIPTVMPTETVESPTDNPSDNGTGAYDPTGETQDMAPNSDATGETVEPRARHMRPAK